MQNPEYSRSWHLSYSKWADLWEASGWLTWEMQGLHTSFKSFCNRKACCLVPYGKLSFDLGLYCWSKIEDLNLSFAACLEILCRWIHGSGITMGILFGIECFLPSYAMCCIFKLAVSDSLVLAHFLGGALKQVNAFFPLGSGSVYCKARSWTCHHIPSCAFSIIV